MYKDSEHKGYKKALVIFIDILGSQSRNNFDELLEINELFHNELLSNKQLDREYIAYQRHIYTFSDCAYIFYDYKNQFIDNSIENLGALFDAALSNCEPLLMTFLSKGLIFRGGVAYGDVYYDTGKSMFFGEAVNKAYQYESSMAIYPRIIVDKYVGDTIISHHEMMQKKYNKKKLAKKNFSGKTSYIVELDTDGLYYLNCFKSIQEGLDYSPIINQTNQEFISNMLTLCNHNISEFATNDRIRCKYEWLKKHVEKSKSKVKVKKSVFHRKPFWDELYTIMKRDDTRMLMHHNVGLSLDDAEFLDKLKATDNLNIQDLFKKYED